MGGFIKLDRPDRKHGGTDGWNFVAKYPEGNNAQRFVVAVRGITGGLVAMHAQSPVNRIELTGSSSERFAAGMAEWRR